MEIIGIRIIISLKMFEEIKIRIVLVIVNIIMIIDSGSIIVNWVFIVKLLGDLIMYMIKRRIIVMIWRLENFINNKIDIKGRINFIKS